MKIKVMAAVLSGLAWCHPGPAGEETRPEPFTAQEREKIKAWAARLEAASFDERQAARKEFEEWLLKNDSPKELLQELLKDLRGKTADLEARTRLEELSKALDSSKVLLEDGKNGVQRATLQARIKSQVGGNYGGGAFSFEHGLRSDDPEAEQKTRNDYDLLFGNGDGDRFQVNMHGGDQSAIKDLGERAWKEAREVFALSRKELLGDLDRVEAVKGHVYLVCSGDKRTGKVQHALFRVEELDPGASCEITWKTIETPPARPVPAELAAKREKGDVILTWKPVKGAKRYRVMQTGTPESEAVETPEPSHLFEKPVPDALHRYEVEAVYSDGGVSETASVEVATHPEGWKAGTFELDIVGQGFSFSQGKVIDRAPGAPAGQSELYVVGSSGTGTELVFAAPRGIGRSAGTAYLQIPSSFEGLAFAGRYRADRRYGPSDSFLVRTPEGGAAGVRVVRTGGSGKPGQGGMGGGHAQGMTVKFAYLYRPPIQEKAAPQADAEIQSIRALIRRLDSDVFEEREKASRELDKLGDRAKPAVEEALKANPSLEVQTQLKKWREKGGVEGIEEEIDGAGEARNGLGGNGGDSGW